MIAPGVTSWLRVSRAVSAQSRRVYLPTITAATQSKRVHVPAIMTSAQSRRVHVPAIMTSAQGRRVHVPTIQLKLEANRRRRVVSSQVLDRLYQEAVLPHLGLINKSPSTHSVRHLEAVSVSSLSTVEILQTLRDLSCLVVLTPGCQAVVLAGQQALCSRINTLTPPQSLQAAHLLYLLQSLTQFARVLFHDLSIRWKSAPPTHSELIQVLFYVSVERTAPVELLRLAEDFLLTRLTGLTPSEVGLASHAFFSSNSRIQKQELVAAIADRLADSLHQFHPSDVANVLKVLRHCHYRSRAFFARVTPALVGRVSEDTSLTNIAHVCSAYASARYRDPSLLTAVEARIKTLLLGTRRPRHKDLARIVWTFACLQGTIDPAISTYAVRQWEADLQAAWAYPEAFIEALTGLAVLKIYPDTLITLATSPRFTAHKHRRPLEQNYQMLLINEGVKLETQQHHTAVSVKIPDRSLSAELSCRKGLLQVTQALTHLLGGQDKVRVTFILHHTQIPDVEFSLDHGRALTLENSVSTDHTLRTLLSSEKHMSIGSEKHMSLGSEKHTSIISSLLMDAEDSEVTKNCLEPLTLTASDTRTSSSVKYVVKVYGENQVTINDGRLIGLHVMEQRLLNTLGYNVLSVWPGTAQRLSITSHEETVRYLQTQLRRHNILV